MSAALRFLASWALVLAVTAVVVGAGSRLMARHRPPRLLLAIADRVRIHYVTVMAGLCLVAFLALSMDLVPWWLAWPLALVGITGMWPLVHQPARGYVQDTDAATTRMSRIIAETLDTEWEDMLALQNRVARVMLHCTVAERVSLGIPRDKVGSIAFMRRHAAMMTHVAVGVGRPQGFIESRRRHPPVRLLRTFVREFGPLVGVAAFVLGRTQVRASPQKMGGRQLRLTGEEE